MLVSPALKILFTKSLMSGVILLKWKYALVVPVHIIRMKLILANMDFYHIDPARLEFF
jgi:hypothetical protein